MPESIKSRVCVVWIDGEHWQECIPKDNGEFFAILDARKNNDYRVFDEIAATLEEVWCASNQTVVSVTTTNESAEPPGEPRNPYKGLKAFRGEDRHDFFGRDSLIEELAAGLEASLNVEAPSTPNARLLSLVGPSGSGKSSVVFAGLLPRLQAGGLSGSEEWVYLDPMIPGKHPIESLTLALARQMPDRSLRTIRDDLEDETTRGLHLLANHLRTRPEICVVLFVDQFEEVFTQMISEEERQHFLNLLVTAVTEPQGAIIVILTLRADFYDRPMHYPHFCELLEVSQRLVLPMDLKGLREAVEKPAGLPDVQLVFEGDLVGDLLFEMQGQVGAMPLLQFTLDQLFQRRRKHQLTLQAFREIGGVKGALARHAESTYASLPTEEHRTMARTLFLRLIDWGLTEQDTIRRRAALAEISLPDAKLSVIIGEVVDTFVSARLLTTNEIGGITTVEVSHEALIREWPRLTEWLREGREDIRLQQAISEDSIEWEQRGKPKDRLYRGSQLTDANTWARRNFPSWSEVTFLQASRRQHMRHIVNILLVIIFLASTTGLSGWLITRLLRPSSNPLLVTTLSNNGPGSLRQAIDVAAAGSTITFDPSLRGIIQLTSGLNITKNLFIRGTRTGALTISGDLTEINGVSNLVDRPHVVALPNPTSSRDISVSYDGVLFHVLFGFTVTISNISFEGSSRLTLPIYNEGTLTLTACIISENTVDAGVIWNIGKLDLINSTVSGNTSRIPFSGGTISNYNGTLTIMNSTISGNRIYEDTGGYVNQAAGGIYSDGVLTLTNSTVSDNTVAYNNGVGGIQIVTGKSNITFSTIYGNTGYIGGIAIGEANLPKSIPQAISRVTIRNSLVAGTMEILSRTFRDRSLQMATT